MRPRRRRGVTATAASARHNAVEEAADLAEGAQRRCIVTGEVRDRGALLRFVVAPSGEIVPDLAARLPGRGLWLTPRRDIVDRAVAKRLFARAARGPVVVPAGLADHIEALLARRCIEAIGLARRAGLAVAGFEKVCETVRAGNAALLLAALDGAETGRRKIRALGRGVPVAAVLTAAELGKGFGREHVVHASIGPGPLRDRLASAAHRIAGFRAGAAVDPDKEPAGGRRGRHDGIGVR
jgi:predicted RNA-binding protein YlxR (DUF448 family)